MNNGRLYAASVAAFACLGMVASAVAAPRATSHAARNHKTRGDVSFDRHAAHGGYRALVSDGPGTGFGFHRLPLPYHIAAVRQRERQADALHQAVIDDALTSGGSYGFYGDSVYGAGHGAAYGVFNGADGYGSPYFAGYYGPGDGADLGPLGHAYAN